ncbi:MAG: 23S rRNA (uracil(1939)-C(5))-methyltransferase RlmD [Candidatus Gracilibacteria bacterium]|nr:23S rRNA (uracil(1939)-C(5))-methyltransferase RlmD [Candidatus Gracilibacteria bacterium]
MLVTIEKVIPGGIGLARTEEHGALFVPYSLPGMEVEVKIVRPGKNFSWAQIVKVTKEAPGQVPAPCPFFGQCGGCAIQNASYEKQLEIKREIVADALRRVGKLEIEPLAPLPSPLSLGYRNKVDFSFKGKEIGFRPRESFDETLKIENCLLFDERHEKVLAGIRKLLGSKELQDEAKPDFLQYLTIRKSFADDNFLVILVTQAGEINRTAWLKAVQESFGESLAGFLWKRNLSKQEKKNEQDLIILSGQDYLHEKIGDLDFKVSAFSFFQTNSLGAKVLYDQVQEFADLKGTETVLDLYCGTGTIGQYLAAKAKEVIGIEINAQAIEDARENAALNNLKNCTYYAGAVKDVTLEHRDELAETEVIIIDPPRAGLDKKMRQRLCKFPNLKKLIYVSCDPVTLARDLMILQTYSFEIVKVQPVDMFPHTAHIENVTLLVKSG